MTRRLGAFLARIGGLRRRFAVLLGGCQTGDGLLGAKVGGACITSRLCGLAGGLIGSSVGLLFAGVGAIPGAVVGSFLGVFLGEYGTCRDWRAAGKATVGMMAGYTLSTGVQIAVGVSMLAIFVWQVLKG